MFEIFYKDKRIEITDNLTLVEKPNSVSIKLDPCEDANTIITKFIQGVEDKELFIQSDAPIELFKKILANYEVIKAAGGLVFNEKNELLMIFRRGKWDLPKGKIEGNETIENAAIREVQEETGIQKVTINGALLHASYHLFLHNKIIYIKLTYWYNMMADKSEILIPQAEEEIEKVAWCDQNTILLNLENSYRNIISLLTRYYNSKGNGNR